MGLMDQAYNEKGRQPTHPGLGRLLLRTPDLLEIVKGKTVAVIGDGESKRKYIYAPENVFTIALNKAAYWYPASCGVVIDGHFDEIIVQLHPLTPIWYIGPVDVRRYNIGPGLWTITCVMRALIQSASKVYIQGFDMSCKRYQSQVPILKHVAKESNIPIINVSGGPLDDIFTPGEPDRKDFC